MTSALLWLVVSAWLLVALTLGLVHGFIVPRIGQWQPELEQMATRMLGVTVRIGQLTAHSSGLVPSLELRQVRLLDAHGADALVLDRVMTTVSMPALWRLGFDQIVIDSPELDIRRRTDGVIEVAGLDLFTAGGESSGKGLDWFFSQSEFVIRSGTVRWTDEVRQQATVSLEAVDLVVRNRGRRHQWRLDATPSNALAGRFTIQGQFRSPFLSLHPGRLEDWSGTAYLNLPEADLDKLASPTHLAELLGLHVHRGQGALRMWVDVRSGQIVQSTADVALAHVHARFAQAPSPMTFGTLSGRITLTRQGPAWEVQTERLALETPGGIHWEPGDIRAVYRPVVAPDTAPGELDASHIDLQALGELASTLPLPPDLLQWIDRLQPRGVIDSLRLRWRGNAETWTEYTCKGSAKGLSLQAGEVPPSTGSTPLPGRPGFAGAAIDFDFSQRGGHAQLTVSDGQLSFPGVFEDPQIALDRLQADLNWSVQGERLQVQVTNARFANADLQGLAQASWQTSDPATGPSRSRFPGVLKLDGTLSRGRGDRIHRYLPLVVATDARHYVRDAILAGEARDVKFRLAGDLWQMPFDNPADGQFHIAGKVSKVDYAFVPPSLLEPGSPRWPVLRQLEGDMVFDRLSMSLNVSKGLVADTSGLKVIRATGRIASLSEKAVVEVQAQVDGPLSEALTVMRKSPLSVMTGQALSQAKGSGNTSVQFGMKLPILHMNQTTVKGQANLPGNDLQITPDSPLLTRAKGNVEFSDTGFWVAQATARLAGGDIQFSGGLRPADPQAPKQTVQFKGTGTATADGLRQSGILGSATRLMERLSGQTAYSAQLTFAGAHPELTLTSTLQGMQSDLPSPLGKSASTPWNLRYVNRAIGDAQANQDMVQIQVDDADAPLLNIHLQRQLTASAARVLRGTVAVGTTAARQPPPMPAQGVQATVHTPELDVNKWDALLTAWGAADSRTGARDASADAAFEAPDRIQLTVADLILGDRHFHDVRLSAQRKGGSWQGQVQSRELAGQFEYQASPPRQTALLKARLQSARLTTGSDDRAAQAITPASHPASMPALDIDVDNFELDGKALGALSLRASNRTTANDDREWQLDRLVLKTPEAQLQGSGSWTLARPNGTSAGGAGDRLLPRQTQLQFVLDIQDAGALLNRLGLADVFRGGKGELKGQIGWLGAPYAMNAASLTGQIHLDLDNGQFLKADPGLAKLLGVLSLQSLPRRLTLDFRDVFSQGFAFDFVRGDARIDQGIAVTNNLQMKGPNAAVLLEGKADVGKETQDLRVLVVPELNAGTASLLATVINPAVGLGTFLAQAILRQPLIKASTQEFRIHGTWTDPQVDRTRNPTEDASPAQ